jgi:hypothetical protein
VKEAIISREEELKRTTDNFRVTDLRIEILTRDLRNSKQDYFPSEF